eukprot:4377282-Alexandrium_andersonii.AAC.1
MPLARGDSAGGGHAGRCWGRWVGARVSAGGSLKWPGFLLVVGCRRPACGPYVLPRRRRPCLAAP